MKTFHLFLCLGLLTSTHVFAQKSCCTAPDLSMDVLASNAEFKRDHAAPKPFKLNQEAGKMVTFKASDGTPGNAYFVPSPEVSNKVVIVFHEWWGLNDYIKQEAEKWQKELGNVNVYAVDLYDGKVATNPDEAGALMGALNADHAKAIVEGLIHYAGEGKEIYTLGYCMGGTWSFEAALLAGKKAKACVMYYGFPEKEQARVNQLKTNILYIYGTKDLYISKEAVSSLAEMVKKAGHTMDVENYDATHAFANPSNPNYDQVNASAANAKALAFLKNAMK